MNFDNLKGKVDKLSNIEQNYPVGDWHWHGIDYWPILKNIVYFRDRKISSNLFKALVKSPKKVLVKVFLKFRNKLRRTPLNTNTYIASTPIDLLFSGAVQHRNDFNNRSLNRYFDPLMDAVENQFTAQLIEYSTSVPQSKIYRDERVSYVYAEYNRVAEGTDLNLAIDQALLDNINLVATFFGYTPESLLYELTSWCKRCLLWKLTWKKLLVEVNPKMAFLLCYYNEPMYGLILAARELGIPTVDMQHGGQGSLHPSYHFENFPQKGYNTLPDFFWVWENTSKFQLDECLAQNKHHHAIVGGNPWIDYLSHQKNETSSEEVKRNIICTLTIGLDSILPDYLIAAIKDSDSAYLWYLRMHPRTPKLEKDRLISIIAREKIGSRVNVEEANALPLPYLLAKAWAHISHSSGSIAEAAMMNVPRNVITDTIGRNNFRELIANGSATYFDVSDDRSLFDFILNLEPNVNLEKNEISYAEKYRLIFSQIMQGYCSYQE